MPIQVPVVQTGLEQSIQQAAAKAGKNLRINMGPGAKSIESLSKPLGRLTGKADEFTKSMEAANARVLAFGASVGVIAAVSKGLQELVKTTIEVEKSLANINSILRQTESQLDSFKNQIFDIARNTGQTFDTVAEAALELSRQGLKAEEVTKRLNDALVLSRLSGLSAADSVAGLTAAVNSFSSAGLTTTEVLNKISAAAASAAVSDRDLIEGLKRSGAVAVASGVQFDELIGIISALQERTARGGAVIGNSLKTIFTRIQDIEKLNALQDLGVQVTDLSGQVLSSNKIIENLAPTFAKLDQASKVNLADNLVGKFQIAPFLALLEDYNLKVSRSGEVAATSFNATNEAYQRNEALSKTLADAVNVATVNLKELANTLGEIGVTDNLKNIIGVFNSVVSSITDILDGDGIGSQFAKGLVKGIGGVLAGPGLALALVAIGKLLLDFAKFGAGALKTFFGLNKAAEAQKNLQGQIAASLLNDKGIRSAILSIEKQNISEGEKKKLQTQFFTKALNEQLMVMQKMQGIARTIAPGVMAGTASRRGKRAAGGFLPIGAESSDISRGVGGAPASAKPVIIPNFAFGGGKRGTMVANDSEYIVPNYANGGDAIFNQHMVSSMGLPANARKVRAASGYIPNFVKSPLEKFTKAYDLQRIESANKSVFFKPDGSYKTKNIKDVVERYPDSIYAKAILAKRGKIFNANAPLKSVMLVPQEMSFNNSAANHNFQSPYKGFNQFLGGVAGINPNLNEKNSKFYKLLQLDATLDSSLTDGVNQALNKTISSSKGSLKAVPKSYSTNEVKNIILQEGGSGAFGALRGAIFEAIINAISGGLKTEKGGTLDVLFDSNRTVLEEIFGVQGMDFYGGDFKNSLGQKTKYAKQVISNKAVFNKAASGYIPNFAKGALEDAIGREQAAGLPISQIRVNQSGKLRNAKNPMGLAVTNTRDEPTGAIPNYAKGGNKDAEKSLGDAGMKAMMLASSLAFVSSAFSDTTQVQDKANQSMIKFTDVLNIAMTAIMTHAALSMLPTKGISSGLVSKGGSLVKTGGSQSISGVMRGGPMGALMKSSGGLLRVFGSLTKFVGRLIPFIGPVILGFQVFSGIMKKFGVDFKGTTSILMNALKKFGNVIMDVGALAFKGMSFGVKKILELVAKIPGIGGGAEDVLAFINNIQGSLDTNRFTTQTFSESLATAKAETSARKVESETKNGTTEEEKKKTIAEQIKRIELSTAKQKLNSQLELAKLELTRKSNTEIALEQAKALNNVSFERLQTLEKAAEIEKFNAETSGLLLDNVMQSTAGVEGLTTTVEKQAAAEKAVREAVKDGNISREDAINIAKELTGLSDQNEKMNQLIVKQIEQGVGQLIEQRDLQKDININEINRNQLLDLQVKKLERVKDAAKFKIDFALSKESRKAFKELSSVDLEIEKLQNSKRGKSKSEQESIDAEIARKKLERIPIEGSSKIKSIEGQIAKLQIEMNNAGDNSDMLRKLTNQIFLLQEEKFSAQEQSQAAEERAKMDLLIAEKGRVLSTSFIQLVDQFDNFALSQRSENLEFQKATASTRRARLEADLKLQAIEKAKGVSDPKERARIIAEEPLRRSYKDRLDMLKKSDLEISSEFKDNLIEASQQFRNNFISAFAEGIESVDSLKDALLNTADQFIKAMTKNFIEKWMDGAQSSSSGGGILGGLGKIFGFSDGGRVNGGSGSRDDVPAMLMGGEYVMNKQAVQRYGTGFMEALNSGSLRGYARGGQVRDEEGMFTTPGMNGAGAIVGGANLMSFATQTPAALGRDTITSSGAFLDAESGRMTMFGRRNNPQFQKVQDAKRQAFDLAIKEREAYAQAEAQKVSLGSMLASAAISTIASFGISKVLGGGDMAKLIGSSLGNVAGTAVTGAPASGGVFGAMATDPKAVSDFFDIFTGGEKVDLSGVGSGSGIKFSPKSASARPSGNSAPLLDLYEGARLGGKMTMLPKLAATGGLIPAAGGVDTVPAMLSGGEFVMNAAATRNIGAGNLQALNSGAGVDNTDLVSKLDELILATEASQSTGEINITVNGSNGTDTQTSGQDTTDQQRQLSERIKVAVKQVIADEQRLGGQLRR